MLLQNPHCCDGGAHLSPDFTGPLKKIKLSVPFYIMKINMSTILELGTA
jgi:hypothetical protein